MVELCMHVNQQKYNINSVIYDIGSNPSTFYIVREGNLCMETIIETDSFYSFPIDNQKWQLRKQTRRIQYKLQELSKGDIFGHEEMLSEIPGRRCRVRT